MAAEAMMRIEQEVKDKLDELKDQLHTKNPSGTIQKLIDYHDRKRNHIPVQDDVRDQLAALRSKLGLRGHACENDLMKLLLAHYETSPNLSRQTFELYAGMRN